MSTLEERERIVRLEVRMENLTVQLKEATEVIERLDGRLSTVSDQMQRGKGAFWFAMVAMGGISFIVAKAWDRVFG